MSSSKGFPMFSDKIWLSAVVWNSTFVVVNCTVTGSGLRTLSNCHQSKGLAFYLETFTHWISCYPLCLANDTSVNIYSEWHNRSASTNLNIVLLSLRLFASVWPHQNSSPRQAQSKELLPRGNFKEGRGVQWEVKERFFHSKNFFNRSLENFQPPSLSSQLNLPSSDIVRQARTYTLVSSCRFFFY